MKNEIAICIKLRFMIPFRNFKLVLAMFTKKRKKNSEKVISFHLMELSERFLNEVLELTFQHGCNIKRRREQEASCVM